MYEVSLSRCCVPGVYNEVGIGFATHTLPEDYAVWHGLYHASHLQLLVASMFLLCK